MKGPRIYFLASDFLAFCWGGVSKAFLSDLGWRVERPERVLSFLRTGSVLKNSLALFSFNYFYFLASHCSVV